MIEEPVKYIKKVEIQGLFGRYDIEWNLHSDVNVLAGINGSGKTTILNCISGLFFSKEIPNIYINVVNKIKISFEDDQYLTYPIKKKEALGDMIITNISLSSYNVKNNQFLLPKLNIENVISTFDVPLKSLEVLEKISDDNVKTELDWDIYNLQNKYLDYQLNLSKRYVSIFKNEKSNKSDFEIKKQFETINFFQDRFLEIIDTSFSETGKKINREKNQLEFLFGDEEINAYQLSSGEKQLLIILLTVLIQDNKPTILFMDEPEISLHIEWQRKLIQYVRELNPNAQVIVATHSPDIIPDGCLDKIFNLQDLIVKDSLVP